MRARSTVGAWPRLGDGWSPTNSKTPARERVVVGARIVGQVGHGSRGSGRGLGRRVGQRFRCRGRGRLRSGGQRIGCVGRRRRRRARLAVALRLESPRWAAEVGGGGRAVGGALRGPRPEPGHRDDRGGGAGGRARRRAPGGAGRPRAGSGRRGRGAPGVGLGGGGPGPRSGGGAGRSGSAAGWPTGPRRSGTPACRHRAGALRPAPPGRGLDPSSATHGSSGPEDERPAPGRRGSPSRPAGRGQAVERRPRWRTSIARARSWASSMRSRTSASMRGRHLLGIVGLVAELPAEEHLPFAAGPSCWGPRPVAHAVLGHHGPGDRASTFSMSFSAPVVGSSKTSSSAVRPPRHMAMASRSWLREWL